MQINFYLQFLLCCYCTIAVVWQLQLNEYVMLCYETQVQCYLANQGQVD